MKNNLENIDNPLLMSRYNPTGLTLEDLLDKVVEELKAKSEIIEKDKCPVSKTIYENNGIIISLLVDCKKIQIESMNALDTIGENKGPTDPRLGK